MDWNGLISGVEVDTIHVCMAGGKMNTAELDRLADNISTPTGRNIHGMILPAGSPLPLKPYFKLI
jgi:hypothetical protein